MAIDYNAFRQEAIKQYPNQAKQIDAFIEQKQIEDLVRSGILDVEEIAKTNPGIVSNLLQQGFNPREAPKKLTAAEQKNADAFNSVEQLVSTLEKRYSEAKGGEYSGMGAIIGGAKKNIAGAIGLNDPARIYNSER